MPIDLAKKAYMDSGEDEGWRRGAQIDGVGTGDERERKRWKEKG